MRFQAKKKKKKHNFILSTLSETDAAAASPSMIPDEPVESEMEISDPSAATVNEPTNSERPKVKRDPRPPPVTVLGHYNLFKTNRELKSILKGDFKVVNTAESLRYYTTSVEDHRNLRGYFDIQKKNILFLSAEE